MLQLRSANLEVDYPVFKSWWQAHNWQAVPKEALPALSAVCYDSETPEKLLAAAWTYMDNSVGVAMIEWVVANPDNTPKESLKSIKMCLEYLKHQLTKGWIIDGVHYHYPIILAATNVQGLIKLYERQNFKVTDKNITHLIYLEE